MTALLVTLALACLSLGLDLLVARRVATLATFYWFGWIAGLASAASIGGEGVLPAFGWLSQSLIIRLNVGAAIGFGVATLMFHLIHLSHDRLSTLRDSRQAMRERLVLSPGLVRAAFLGQLCVGLITLGYRLRAAGGAGGLATLLDLRASFLQATYLVETLPLPVRLSNHLGLLLGVFPFLFALQDALAARPNLRRIGLWWLASVPAGISTGGRGWIVGIPVLYVFTFLSIAALRLHADSLRRLARRGLLAVASMMVLFVGVERMRSESSLSTALFERVGGYRWYHSMPSVLPVLYYLGIPSLAVEQHATFAEGGQRYGGALTFPFVASQLRRLGFDPGGTWEEFTLDVRSNAFYGPYPVLSATHGTIVTELVGDYGMEHVPVTMCAIAFAMQLSFLLLRRAGIVRRFVAVQIAIFGGLWTFQEFSLGQAGAVLPVIWLILLIGAAVAWRPRRARRWIRLESLGATPLGHHGRTTHLPESAA